MFHYSNLVKQNYFISQVVIFFNYLLYRLGNFNPNSVLIKIKVIFKNIMIKPEFKN